jgi:N-acetylglucosaminyl-diphospho-decaprenol L-rhamnosyltransferase
LDLSIIIVNWNTRDLLRACLASLPAALAPSLSAEILVIDNASADGSAQMVAAEFGSVRLFANTENLGYAAGNNQGFEAAIGGCFLLLNPDTELPAGSITELVRFLRERPEAGAVAPRLIHPDGRIQRSVRGFPTPLALLGEVTGLARLAPWGPWAAYRGPRVEPEQPVPVDQPMASCLLFRREAIEQAGGMDTDFPIFFNDVDLCRRVRDKGWEIWYNPTVAIIHHGGASTRQVRPRMVWESHHSLHRYYQKHYRGRLFRPLYGVIVAAIYAAGALRYGWARWQARRSETAHAR